MSELTKPIHPDRSEIDLCDAKYWTHALRVTEGELRKAIDKVGNSAASVRKELGLETKH